MCGRYVIYTAQELFDLRDIVMEAQHRVDEAERRAGETGGPSDIGVSSAELFPTERDASLRVKTGEVFPTDIAPVLVSSDTLLSTPPNETSHTSLDSRNLNNLQPHPMVWGFPQFGGRKGVIFNTRIESAPESAFWRESLAKRRCVIPTNGFFEWQHGGPQDRQRYLFTTPDEPILYLAGIYQNYSSAAPGDGPQAARAVALVNRRFSIMTTAPNASISDVHNRMPIVLRACELDEWLCGDPLAFLDRNHIDLLRHAS